MLEIIQSQILFYFAIGLVLFMPGYFMLLAFFGKAKLGTLERFVIAGGLSILVSDFLMLFLYRIGILFTQISLTLSLVFFCAICQLIYYLRFRKNPLLQKNNVEIPPFSSKQFYFIILVIFLSVFLRTAYLQDTIPSGSTDLGHHMYWSKLFAQTGEIHDYTQSDVLEKNGNYQFDAPRPISDFVIGEHLIFSAINLISKLSFFSVFPILTLFWINMLGILAIFILSLRLFEESSQNTNIAIFALFFSGALFAIDPPQAKFIGGGVVGNIIGNLLIPLAFYFYIRFLREKLPIFLFFALFFSMGLFYTHHLSALIFLLVFAGFIVMSFIFNPREMWRIFIGTKKILLSPLIISFVIFATIFISAIYLPTYITNSAVTSVVGAVKKIEHTGLSMLQFRNILGESRFALGSFGLLLVLILFKKTSFRPSFLLIVSWISVITLISLAPSLVKISIPSGRVANYGVYPFAILSAFTFISLFGREKSDKELSVFFSKKLILNAFFFLLVFIFINSFMHNASFLRKTTNGQNAQATRQAGAYLSEKIGPNDSLASDHVYLFADSWIKLFFMRDYYFPSYRANFERYENGIDKKEFCTREMISNPGSEFGEKCFFDLGTNFVIINGQMDSAQFQKLPNFWQIYSNEKVNIYYREK